jgi:hypothetical protein
MSSTDNRLIEILTAKQRVIVARWRDAIIRTYPKDTAKFLKSGKNQFANPVGYAIAHESKALFEALLADAELADCAVSIDNIVRIRAVQDLTAAQATRFVFLLKDVIAEVLAAELADTQLSHALLEFHKRIDQLSMLTFDTYMSCRDKVHQIRAGERRKWGLRPSDTQELPALGDKEKNE